MFSKDEIKQMIAEAIPKIIPMSSPNHPKHAEWKADNAKPAKPRTTKDPDAKLLHPIKTDTHEHLIKAIDKYGPGKVDHILKTRPVVTTHNGKKVAGVHVTAYHGINNKRDLGMDDDGESEEIFHHIVHRHADNHSKLDSYQTSAKMQEEVEQLTEIKIGDDVSFKHPKTSYGAFGKVLSRAGDLITLKTKDGEHLSVHRTLNKVQKSPEYPRKMREEVELEEADRGYDSGSTRHSVAEIKKDFPKHFKSDNITVHPHVNDSMHHLVIDHDTHNYGTVLHPRKGEAKKGPVWSDAPEVESPTAFMGKKEREAAYQKIAKIYAPHKLKEEVELDEAVFQVKGKDGHLHHTTSSKTDAMQTYEKLKKITTDPTHYSVFKNGKLFHTHYMPELSEDGGRWEFDSTGRAKPQNVDPKVVGAKATDKLRDLLKKNIQAKMATKYNVAIN